MRNTGKWTQALAVALTTAYCEQNKTVSDIAKEFNRTERSIISKLTTLGVYEAKEKPASKPVNNKAQTVAAIETLLSIPANSIPSVTGATVAHLDILVQAIIKKSEQVNIAAK